MNTDFYRKGEIVHHVEQEVWMQFVEEDNGEVCLFTGQKYVQGDLNDIKKAELPLALDGLGFKLIYNDKRGTEKYQYKTHVIDLTDTGYFIKGQQVYNIGEVQMAFNLYKFIDFHLLESRLLGRSSKSKKDIPYA